MTELYSQTTLSTKLTLSPNLLNNDIDENILKVLKLNVEGKINHIGLVMKVLRIVSYTNGFITAADFSGSVTFDVKYECKICCPSQKLIITCLVEKYVKGYAIGKNGPLICACELHNIDTQRFATRDGKIYRKDDNKIIDKDVYIRVMIINAKYAKGETTMECICKLLDISDKNDIDKFNKDNEVFVKQPSKDTDEDDEEYI